MLSYTSRSFRRINVRTVFAYNYAMNNTKKNGVQKVKRRLKSKPGYQTQFLGLHKLFDNNYSCLPKFLWLIVIISCSTACFFQIGVRVSSYLQGSITLDVKMRQQTNFQFPTITLCVARLRVEPQNGYRANETVNLTNLWLETRMEADDLSACLGDTEEGCEGPALKLMNIDFVDTVLGSCTMLTLKDKMAYRGPFTTVNINMSLKVNKNDSYAYLFFVHSDNLKHVHDGIFISERGFVSKRTKFRIHAKEIINLNTAKKPCMSTENYTACINNCINEKITRVLTCRFPNINSPTLQLCNQGSDVAFNYNKMMDTTFKINFVDACKCKRKCNEMKYTLYKDSEREHSEDEKDHTMLVLLYADDMHVTVTEREVFTASGLFSEIGGTLGLYLGISILAIIDVINSVTWHIFIKYSKL